MGERNIITTFLKSRKGKYKSEAKGERTTEEKVKVTRWEEDSTHCAGFENGRTVSRNVSSLRKLEKARSSFCSRASRKEPSPADI